MASPYSPMNLAQKLGSPSTIDFPFGRKSSPLQQSWGTTHKRIGSSQVTTKGLNHRLGSNDPRVTSSRTFTSTNPRGEHKPMHKSNGKNTRSAQVIHSQIPPKATNAYGGEDRKNKEENHTRTPRSRSTRFPSLRGEMDWWKYRSRSPLSNPSKICKNHRRDWEGASFSKVSNGGERGKKRATSILGRWGRRPP